MDVDAPLALLGGLAPAAFMRRHWQRRPLVVRRAFDSGSGLVSRARLFALAGQDGVESRLVVRAGDSGWRVRQGPLPRRALPPLGRPGWTLLVQGLEQHAAAAAELLARFRFVPDARLDDLMLSWASDGGGVGPHVDSYDVFLLQTSGRRRWRVGRVRDARLVDGLPLKVLAAFEPEHDWLLDPGDLLYLPPGWGHDGIAVGECTTASIGFRAPRAEALAGELLQRLADGALAADGGEPYRDPRQPATATPAAVPPALLAYARAAVERLLAEPQALQRALGEVLSEPMPHVWFDRGVAWRAGQGLQLPAKTRMLYDARHVYVNGEAFAAGGRDARLLQALADRRLLPARDCARFSDGARELLAGWVGDGWLEGTDA